MSGIKESSEQERIVVYAEYQERLQEQKGIIKKNNADRHKSRASAMLKKA